MNTKEINERLRAEWDKLDGQTKEMLQNFAEKPNVFGQGYAMGYLTALSENAALPDGFTWFMVIGEIAAGEPNSHIILSWPVA